MREGDVVDKTLVKNSELANIPFSACALLTTTCIITYVCSYSVTHCRSGGRLCCVSHTPRGSWYLGMLYLSDHWEAFWRPQFFTNISTKFICSSRSSATTNYTYKKTQRKKFTHLALSYKYWFILLTAINNCKQHLPVHGHSSSPLSCFSERKKKRRFSFLIIIK